VKQIRHQRQQINRDGKQNSSKPEEGNPMIGSFVPTAADVSSTMLSVLAFPLLSDLAVVIFVLGVSAGIVAVTMYYGEKCKAPPDQQPKALNDSADSAKLHG
jgi:hypothetical protein